MMRLKCLAVPLLLVLSACSPAAMAERGPVTPLPAATAGAVSTQKMVPSLAPTFSPSPEFPPSSTPAVTATVPPSGPDEYPPGVNPLTGLPVADPADLLLPPALVSISNSPVTTRPQAGLSYASHVYEMYIGVGDSRFLAVFHGDLPPAEAPLAQANPPPGEQAFVGPIRSGRLPYESLRLLYKGFLVFASASDRVLPALDEYSIIYGEGATSGDVNRALLGSREMRSLAREHALRLGKPHLSGLRFDPRSPTSGRPAASLWLPWHNRNQVLWKYDRQTGGYQRWQDDGSGANFTPQADRLNGQPLVFDNVVVMFAAYHYYDPVYFNIDLLYISRQPALLFRDGRMLEVYWSTGNTDYERKTGRVRPPRLVDYEGNAIPLKPGSTWWEIVPLWTPYGETAETEDWYQHWNRQEAGSGHWAVYFQAPALEGLPTASVTPGTK